MTFRRGRQGAAEPGGRRRPPGPHRARRTATIEKILHDVDGRLYFAVTVDGDPGQDLLRDTGRFLYFFSEEVEPA